MMNTEVPGAAAKGIWKGSWVGDLEDSFQIIPNTIGIESSSSSISLRDGLIEYKSQGVEDGSAWSQAAKYLQAFSITRQQTPRKDGVGRWKFQFTPAGSFSYKKIYFPDFKEISEVNFKYLNLGLGVGPEFGRQAGRHYGYIKFIPQLAYNRIEWHQSTGDSELTEATSLAYQVELGYLYYVTESLNIRFYSKTNSSHLEVWRKALQKINPSTPFISNSTEIYSGFAVGYTFTTRPRLSRQVQP